MDRGYYRHPTIARDRIAFVCEDDLWSVSAEGGTATRLTVSFGLCTTPRLSPAGDRLAFVSTDEGHPEIYVMPTDGGVPRRLTYLGSTLAAVVGWSPDGNEILFVANPAAWYDRETRCFAISPDGGQPRELGLGHARSFAFLPGGGVVVGRNADDPARWKRYRGGTSGEVWIDRDGSGLFERVPLPDGNPVAPMWIDGRLYVLADHEGIGNIYSCTLDGGELRRCTHEGEYYVRHPATDGARIVYACGGELRIYDPASDRVRPLDVRAPSPAPQLARRFESGGEHLEHFAPDPHGTHVGLIVRGQPVTMPLFEGAVLHHGAGSRVRYRLLEWLADGKRFVCVTDTNGYEQLALHHADGVAEPRLLTTTDIGRVTELAVSPSAEVIAFANHRHELYLLDLDDGKLRAIDRSPAHRVNDLAFSPDGRFLAYAWWPADGVSIIRVAKVKSGKVRDVTAPLRIDASPAWDPQGRYLYFLSTRDFHPVYDALHFDLGFPRAQRPFLVTLREETPSPFAPVPRPIHRDHDHGDERKGDKPPEIEIDFDGIAARALAFPVEEGRYDQLVAVKGRVLFTRFEVRGIEPHDREDDGEETGTLLAYDLEQQRCATLAHDVSEIRLGGDGRTLLYRSHDRLRAIDALCELPEDGDEHKPPHEPGRKSGWLDLGRVSIEVRPPDEWVQMYREAWRLQAEHFWVEDMSDIDWDRVHDRYAVLLPKLRTRSELSDLIWEMQGELGTSHAYEFGGDYRVPPQYRRGFLGADLSWDGERDAWRIERIYRGDSWNRDADSPLAEPGLRLREGDLLLAIGGVRLSRDLSPDQALVNAAGKEIALVVRDRSGEERTVVVKALASEARLRYRAWVERNRAYVHERTGGSVGYVHIPDMGPWGFAEFHRGFLSEFDRNGLIVDVRYNRGGHVSALLLEKLARKRVGFDVPRYGMPLPYPPESVAGPMIAITNQFAGSDGDIFSHCFKLYGLGPLVGKRTWGGVIGINPTHHLVDGTVTTQPEYSFWFMDVGWKVENHGVDPDYDVDVAPHDYREGRDPQLDVALRLMDEALARVTPLRPNLRTRPSLPLPTLP
jgi:tricorn protease